MPLTVITVKNVPPFLRGDLTKWMQEIATGVYVGNFNSKVREELWERVKQSVATGEATMSYACRNEIGYQFETYRTQRVAVDYEGILLVQLVHTQSGDEQAEVKHGFSDAAKFHKARKYAANRTKANTEVPCYIVLDIETDGLNENEHAIIEIGAVRVAGEQISEYHAFVQYDGSLPKNITELTGITNAMLAEQGRPISQVLAELVKFVDNHMVTGYGVDFDCRFINKALRNNGLEPLNNKVLDLMKFVKKEKKFLKNYQLETVLQSYEIDAKVPHRALLDARIICELSYKVNHFQQAVK